MGEVYSAEFENECCLKAAENHGNIEIEGLHEEKGEIRIFCKECWLKTFFEEKSAQEIIEESNEELSDSEMADINLSKCLKNDTGMTISREGNKLNFSFFSLPEKKKN